MSASVPMLKWSSQLTVTPYERSSHLIGDKITLPQSVLEQLLEAATVTVSSEGPTHNQTGTFDPYNPYSYAAERDARSRVLERRQDLPHPLTFRLVNPQNGNVVYAGIREFSAKDNEVGLSLFLRQALGLKEPRHFSENTTEEARDFDATINTEESARLTVHAQSLPKGTYVRLRPLEAGYDPEDWKSLLERHLRDNFTTLTNGEIFTVPAGNEEFRFLVDKLSPEGQGICIIDTDLEVDIEALNEEQARETLKQRLQRSQKAPGTKEGSSAGGKIEVNVEESGRVLPGEYVDYTLGNWDRSKSLEIRLGTTDGEENVDLYVSPMGPRQRSKPREDEHIFGDYSERPTKKIRISHTNTEVDDAEAIWISVHGYKAKNGATNNDITKEGNPLQYNLQIQSLKPGSSVAGVVEQNTNETPSLDETQCNNCHQWVPKRVMLLHENFCFRNNVACSYCEQVFKKSSLEWSNHWHCPHDSSHGNSVASRQKHDHLQHTPISCPKCDCIASNTPSLAHHRSTSCPGKLIVCQFCRLLVPQQGPSDPSPLDPEVILSGLTPHELADGARTTECHLCGKIVHLRYMATHLRHHDLERSSRSLPRICRNVNCGRTIDGVGPNGEVKQPHASRNDIGVCDACYGPLYNSSWDPEGKALRRRVERRYLTQLLTGCGKDWCRNEFCRTGRKYLGLNEKVMSKEALAMTKPFLEKLSDGKSPLSFCTDEASQKRRVLAEMMAAEGSQSGSGKGKEKEKEESRISYDLEWCVTALEAENADLDKATLWLRNWAPTRITTPE
ncbi:hypothetical protein MMC06_004670 [Schaereria dolodes]|nr:hypothetical protein [Schaereria dolodes]